MKKVEDAIVHQLISGSYLAVPGNLFDSVDGLREGTCEVKQKRTKWNQKGTKRAPTSATMSNIAAM